MEVQPLPRQDGVPRRGSQTAKKPQKGEKTPSRPDKVDRVDLAFPKSKNPLVASIRAKIQSGFYKSDEVDEDISEKLARLFDR